MQQHISLESALPHFQTYLLSRNTSSLTQQAYTTDVHQFITWLKETTVIELHAGTITKTDINEYLAYLADLGRSGVTRARKLASIREFFRYLYEHDFIPSSPAASVAIPKKERKQQTYLRPDEYARLLSAAGSHPRDFAMLQVLLQTGIRVSELVSLTLTSVDMQARTILVAGKGNKERTIPLEKKGILALKNYLAVRPKSLDQHVFLNYNSAGISRRGAEKIIEKYRAVSGITKQFSCHSLRHTFGSYKATQGVSPFQLKEWMGHSSISTTQIYVHMGQEGAKKAMEATSL
jgi:site-specific recombinase XerD